jgi:hypothetical protein
MKICNPFTNVSKAMKNSTKDLDALHLLFIEKKVLTVRELKGALHSTSRMTVYRRLSHLDYNTSYSHAGRYYTLHSIARYDRFGLWAFNGIYFSKRGILSHTIEYLVDHSKLGYFASELHDILHVFVHNELFKLYQAQKLERAQIGKEFLYLSTIYGDVQLQNRKDFIQTSVKKELERSGYSTEHIKGLKLFLSVLNEKQRRLFLGFESLRIGYGGDAMVSKISGVDVRTVSRGRKELLTHDISVDRIRTPGGGRPSLKKN